MSQQPRPRPSQGPRINEAIRARTVLLVDADGTRVGEVPLPAALARAVDAGLDLVEVAPGATPPVCRIADYGKMRYEASLRDKAARRSQHSDEVREIKLRPSIGDHDYQVKLRKLVELLDKGHRVKVTIMLKGRMQSRPESADGLLARVEADVADRARCEGRKHAGRNSTMLVVPTKAAR